MAVPKWLWASWEYLCFLAVGIVVAASDSNPIVRIKRRFFHKLPSPAQSRDRAVQASDFEANKRKVAIVTGGNAGIGLETSYFLMKAGYRVVIGCRSAKAGEDAVRYLQTEAAILKIEASVEVISLDLASQESISSFVREVKNRNLPVSILVNNAGVMFIENIGTKEGFEVHFGVNHLGHFKLAVELLPVLAKNSPSRIVTLTSDTYAFGTFDLGKARGERFHRWWAYCDSKLNNLLCVRGLHRKLQEAQLHDRIKIYAVHPGSVSTGITRGTCSLIGWLYSLTIVKTCLNLLEPRDGASGSIYCALSPEVNNLSGEYFATTFHEEVAKNAKHKEAQEDALIAYSEQATHTNLAETFKQIRESL